MRTWLRLVLLWTMACALATLARTFLVYALGVWTPDGRLAVSPTVFGFVNTVHLTLAGAGFLALAFRPAMRWGQPPGKP